MTPAHGGACTTAKEQRMEMLDMAKGTATGKDVLEAGLTEVSKLRPALTSCGFKLGKIEIGVAASPSITVTIERTHGNALSLATMLEKQDLTSTQRALVTSVHKAYAMAEMIRGTGHEVEGVRIALGVHPAVTIVLASAEAPAELKEIPSTDEDPAQPPAPADEAGVPTPAERTLASAGRTTVIGPGMPVAQTAPRPAVRPSRPPVPPPERIVTLDPEDTLIEPSTDREAADAQRPLVPAPPAFRREVPEPPPQAQPSAQPAQPPAQPPPQAQPPAQPPPQAQPPAQPQPPAPPPQAQPPAQPQPPVPPPPQAQPPAQPPPQAQPPAQPQPPVPPPPQAQPPAQPQPPVPPPPQAQPPAQPQPQAQLQPPPQQPVPRPAVEGQPPAATQIDRELAPAQPAALPPTQMESARVPMASDGYAAPPPVSPHAGSWVLVTWSDGNRYRGQVLNATAGQCLVQFEDGACHWVPVSHLSST